MTRTYRLLRFIPDPVRGESLNVAVIGQDGSSYRVLAVEDAEASPRLEKLAPHVDASVLVDFLRELRSAERHPERLEGALSAFDPHFIVEEPLRLGTHRPFEEQLSAAFRDLVATPRRRRKRQERGSLDVKGALQRATERMPAFRRIAKQKVDIRRHPELFGLGAALFEREPSLPALTPFDVVLPNCNRVVAFRGFLVTPEARIGPFIEKRAQMEEAKRFFEGAESSKHVMTGALLLAGGHEPIPLAHRDMTKDILRDAVTEVTAAGRAGPAVFDLLNPSDEAALEQLAAEFEAAANAGG